MSSSLKTLHAAILDIHGSLTPRHVISSILAWSKRLIQCRSCALIVPQNPPDSFKLFFTLPDHDPSKFKSAVIRESQCLEKWILSTGKPQIIHDTSQKNMLKNIVIPNSDLAAQLLAIPLKVRQKSIAVLEIFQRRGHAPFSQKQLRLLEMYSAQSAISLQNAWKYTEQQSFLREQKRHINSTTAQLRDANERLRETDKNKSESISMIAHELRSPITSISGFAKILHSGNLGPLTRDQKEFCGIIQKNTENIDRLIGDLLDMTKLELGRLELRFETLSCSELIKEAVFSIHGAANSDKERIHIATPSQCYVLGDRLRLVQVLINFLSNALKYSPVDSPIKIHAVADQEFIIFSVDDHGESLQPEQYKRVFEKFTRIKTSSKKTTGSGLGLAISKIIIERHDGNIWAEPLPGGGNRFCFRIKASENPEIPAV